jgi:hypothetical protein
MVNYNPERSDVNDTDLSHSTLSVGTTAVEVKIGAVRNPSRQVLVIYNDSNKTVFLGDVSVTISGATKGIPLISKQSVVYSIGDIPIYAITDSPNNVLILQELS